MGPKLLPIMFVSMSLLSVSGVAMGNGAPMGGHGPLADTLWLLPVGGLDIRVGMAAWASLATRSGAPATGGRGSEATRSAGGGMWAPIGTGTHLQSTPFPAFTLRPILHPVIGIGAIFTRIIILMWASARPDGRLSNPSEPQASGLWLPLRARGSLYACGA